MDTDCRPYFDEMIAMRRTLHAYPEEGWCEFATTARIIAALKAMGVSYAAGEDVLDKDAVMGRDEALVDKAMRDARAQDGVDPAILDEIGRYTGVVATIEGARPGKTIAFRCDIDCVLSCETEDPEHLPNRGGFASRVPGRQHSCGHDGHAALGLALCHWLADHKDELAGRFKVLFQPAEEGVRGAAAMAAKGVVDDVDVLVGSHVGCGLGLGEVGVITKGFLATTKLDVEFFGKSAHAGSDPEKGRSALVAAAAAVMALQGIPRHSKGATRVAIGTLHSGTGRNVVPDYAKMQCEVRGATKEVNAFMVRSATAVVEGVAHMYGVQARITKAGEAIDFTSDDEVTQALVECARAVPGLTRVEALTTDSGSEDCSILMDRVQSRGGKAGFFLWGGPKDNHHCPDFDIADTESMPVAFEVAAKFFAKMAGPRAV